MFVKLESRYSREGGLVSGVVNMFVKLESRYRCEGGLTSGVVNMFVKLESRYSCEGNTWLYNSHYRVRLCTIENPYTRSACYTLGNLH